MLIFPSFARPPPSRYFWAKWSYNRFAIPEIDKISDGGDNCGRQIKISLGTSSLQKVAEILIVAQNNAQLCDLLLPWFFDFKCKIFAKLFLSRGKFAKIFIEIKEISKSRIECALRLIAPKRYVREGKSIRSGWAVRLLLYFHPKNHGARTTSEPKYHGVRRNYQKD